MRHLRIGQLNYCSAFLLDMIAVTDERLPLERGSLAATFDEMERTASIDSLKDA